MLLDEWDLQWNIPPFAIRELRIMLGTHHEGTAPKQSEISEAGIQSLIRREATKKGARLWRNNVGATPTPQGSFIRYGLANESSVVNSHIKSADLIGIKPVLITQKMVGATFGQFLSREVKHPGWQYTGNERERAQLKWAELIISLGGDAAFATGEGTL